MAQALGSLLCRRGVPVVAVAGRRPAAARQAAAFIGAPQAVATRELPLHAQRILLAVADDAIAEVAQELIAGGLKEGIVLHTSAAAGPGALASLRPEGNAVGVLHPLQSVPSPDRGLEVLAGSTFGYGGDPAASLWARSLIHRMQGKGLAVDPERWQQYHAAAVMASNYHVALVDAALELLEQVGLDRRSALDALAPLIRSTTDCILLAGPEAALTGPIRRGDVGTVRRHMAALETASPATKQLYAAAGLRSIPVARRAGLPAESAIRIAEAIEERISS